MTIPAGIKVELALTTTPDDPAPAWTDITTYVEFQQGITITRGRQNEFGTVQPGTLTLTLNNTDGRFTAGLASGAYYPNIKIRKKIRVTTLAPSAVSSRFTGYVDEWPTEWVAGSEQYSLAQITAVDRFKRLSRLAQLANIISEEYLLDSPTAYFTLGEPADSVTAGDTSRTGTAVASVTQQGTGGTLEFAKSTGPGTDGMSSPLFTAVDTTNGKYLYAPFPGGSVPDGAFTLECFFNTALTTPTQYLVLMGPFQSTTAIQADINVKGSTGELGGYHNGVQLTSAAVVADGLTHHAALVFNGTTTLTLYLDGVSAATSADTLSAIPSDGLTVGGITTPTFGGLFTGTVAHAAYYRTALSAARILAHAQAGLTGFAGERSDQRVARFASYAGIPTAEQNLETGLSASIASYDTTGKDPLAGMQDITATESGVLQMQGDGKLNFQSRSHRYNTASVLTIPGKDLGEDTKFIFNDQLLINDVTASRPGGITYRSADTASITEYGTSKQTLTLYVTTDNEVINAADWNSHRLSTPTSRVGNLTVDILANTGIASAVLGLDVGSKVTVNTLPAQAPAASVDLFVEGWTETITPDMWKFVFNTSPAEQFYVWQLDSATYSQLGVSTRLGY